jgi:hypothetical protein
MAEPPTALAGAPPAPSALRQGLYRIFEAAPGLVTWTMLLSPFWIPLLFGVTGAFFVAIAVLVFDCYWFARSFMVITGIRTTYRRMQRDMATDWLARCRELVETRAEGLPDPLEYYHLNLIPTYTEPLHVLDATVRAIVEANYPAERKIVAIITRETDRQGWENVAILRERYAARLGGFYHIKDPLEPGIVIGKSAAMNYGGRWIYRELTTRGYDPAKVLLLDLDSDYRVHPQYFAWISYHHALQPLRDYTIWQPVPLFHNNIWESPIAIRIVSGSTSQWQMFLHTRKHRLVAFSSYSCSLQFADDVGWWDKDVIPEDSRFYWKAFFTFGRRFAVRSVWLPIYGDSPTGRDYAAKHASQYNQIKRWAWGITDVPYVLARLFKHPEIPLWYRIMKFGNLFLNHLNWIFLPVFLIFGASIPVWVSVDFSLTDLGGNLTTLSSAILSITVLQVVWLIWVEYKMLPPPPNRWGDVKRFFIFVQYFLYPVVGLVLSVLPALEAHTRLLLGKYLEYRVTEKG